MINPRVLVETVVCFWEGQKRLPGRPTIRRLRWAAERGILSKITGRREYLEWAQLGNERVTSMEAWERFHLRLNGHVKG